MAKSIQELREERSQIAAKMTALVEKPEDQSWTVDDQKSYDDHKAAIEGIDNQIKRKEEILNLTSDQQNHVNNVAEQLNISNDEATARNLKLKACTNAWMRGGVEALTSDQRTFMQSEVRRVNAAMGTQEANNGAALVHREFVARLLEAMKAFGGMRAVATILPTDTGNPMDMPTTDATSEEGEIVGENTTASSGDIEFGTLSMGAFKYSSKSIALPFELLQDSGIDIEAHVIKRLAMRLARIQNKHFTIGTGTGQPKGVVTAASVGKTSASATAITFDELNHLVHSVDPAYRESGACKFMFNDLTLRDLKDKKDTTGRPIWLPSISETEPDRILGYGYQINQQMADVAASAKPVAFGDLSHYTIRDVMALMMFRMTDSAFTLKGQVGFVGFQRADGNLLDVGGAVKTLQCAAS
ncbi:phage major capsid protein [Oceanobacter sp. 3_MG-2023]|uniref:phage major capsid protein n=1 Tax=Oceanobacter sp. 3_MG-2023 TaxID=3062622 RepID=UPI002737385B|nr:phage major capsid protein [Oceanobacter sp. 3_MG-2023]MDP2505390.1 phage major capsid protein [Oceanobacter sp. 3_MG-2023]